MVSMRCIVRPLPTASLHVDQEHGQAFGALLHLIERRGAHQQQHQVGFVRARGPDFLAVDDVVVALADSARVFSWVVSEPVVGSVTPKA